MGTHVQVSQVLPTSMSIGTNDANDLVVSQIAALSTLADETIAKLDAALVSMADIFASAAFPNANVTYNHVEGENLTVKDIGAFRPSRVDLTAMKNAADALDKPERGELIPIQVPQFPPIPTFDEPAPDDTFEYTEAEYQSTLADAVKVSLLDWILNGGTGLATSIEQAIWDRARARLTDEWERARDDVEGFYFSRGWNIPPGMQNAMIRRVNEDFNKKLEDLNQQIAIKQAELAQNNTHFAHTLAVQVEEGLMNHFNAVASRLFDAAKTTITLLYQIFTEKVKAYSAEVQAVAIGIDAEAKKIDAQVSINENIAKIYEIDMARFNMELDLIIKIVEAEAKIYAAEVNGYGVEADLARAELDAAVEQLKGLMSQATDLTSLNVKEAENILQAYLGSLGLNVEASKATASVLAQVASSIVSAINTHAGVSDGVSRSEQVSVSHSEGLSNRSTLSESHSYTYNNLPT